MRLTEPDDEDDGEDGEVDGEVLRERDLDVMPYKPPGPPPQTGLHRYVFVALVPSNGTTDRLNLEKPGDRQHWVSILRTGVAAWLLRFCANVCV